MSTRQRTPQPLERAVNKALARRAQLRAESAAQPKGLETPPVELAASKLNTTKPTLQLAPAPGAPPSDLPASDLPARNTGRAALSAETMDLIERMAKSGPFADAAPEEKEDAAPLPPPIRNLPVGDIPDRQEQPTDAHSPERNPQTETPTPAQRSNSAGKPIDAFQLLLSSNPAAGDNRRNDLPAAPGVRNPRNALAARQDSPAAPAVADAQPGEAVSADDAVDADDKERSLRRWFSPRSDPNPPPPPESDPTRD